MSNRFALFYRDKIEGIRNYLVETNRISLSLPAQKFNGNVFQEFKPVSADEIMKIINSLANKQSFLDILPFTSFKQLFPHLLPFLTKLINSSLNSGIFPSILKLAVVTPILKSSNLDTEILNHYRPVSGLRLLSKVFERVGLDQLSMHLNINNLYPVYQSAYRPYHSCETALTKITDDIIADLSPTTYIMMALLDFSAAFDTVDHKILIDRMSDTYGVRGTVLKWFESYLTDRSYKVKVNKVLSDKQQLKFGVPQGSILGPILYSLYVNQVEHIAAEYSIKIHVYADDIQLYTTFNQHSSFHNFQQCLQKIRNWANNNFLKLNNKKTQIICFSKNYKYPLPTQIDVMDEVILVENSAKYLGVWLDRNLTFSKQINSVCSSGYMMLRNLWRISDKVSDIDIRKQLVHTCILSRLNFCNMIYYFLPKYQLYKLDKLLKAGVRFIYKITGKERRKPMTPHLHRLHFLPIILRVKFKVGLLVYKCFNGQAPEYLKDLLIVRENQFDRKTRKDGDLTWLSKPPIEPYAFQYRAFRHAAPEVWSALNVSIRESETIESFKSNLKTFYFEEWLNTEHLHF